MSNSCPKLYFTESHLDLLLDPSITYKHKKSMQIETNRNKI